MVGTVNFMLTLEVLFQLIRKGFDGVIYFDTFPDVSGLDPVRECENNIAMVNSLGELAKESKGATGANRTPSIVKTPSLVRISSGGTIFAQTRGD